MSSGINNFGYYICPNCWQYTTSLDMHNQYCSRSSESVARNNRERESQEHASREMSKAMGPEFDPDAFGTYP